MSPWTEGHTEVEPPESEPQEDAEKRPAGEEPPAPGARPSTLDASSTPGAASVSGPARFCLFDPDQFRGRVAMVTGAGKGTGPGGIGYNAAMAFARAGARLAIVGRTEETLRTTAAEIEALGSEVVTVVGDVSEEAVTERLFEATLDKFGRLDILINNAGVSGEVRALVRIPSKSFRYAFNVHLHTMTTTRMAARHMRERGIAGTILNVGTYFTSPHRQVLRPYPFRTPYTGAQAWKLEHARLSAWELARDGIRVIALNLGPVEGGRIDSIVYPLGAMERGLWGREVRGQEIRKKTEGMHPAKRFLTQDDAARSILALVSKEMRDSANGTVVELAGGVDYKVPPMVAPPLLGGQPPDLKGKQVVLIGRPEEEQAATLLLAFAACGASVVLACPDAGRILANLAEGRTPEQYSDGQRALLGKARAVDLRPDIEEEIAALFDRLTTSGPEAKRGPEANSSPEADHDPAAVRGPDVVVVLTGDVDSAGSFANMSRGEQDALKQRFAFEPAAILKHAQAALLLEGMRRAAGLARPADESFLALRPFMALLDRPRGVASSSGMVQRVKGGWTSEEEKALQAGARQARGSLVVVGPALCRDLADDVSVTCVVRASMQAVVTSVATEMASARSPIRVNANIKPA